MTKDIDGSCTLVVCLFLIVSLLTAAAVHSAGPLLVILGIVATEVLSLIYFTWKRIRNLSFWSGCSAVAGFCLVAGFLYGFSILGF